VFDCDDGDGIKVEKLLEKMEKKLPAEFTAVFNEDERKKIVNAMMTIEQGKVSKQMLIKWIYCFGPVEYLAKNIKEHFWDEKVNDVIVEFHKDKTRNAAGENVQEKDKAYLIRYSTIDENNLDASIITLTRGSLKNGTIKSTHGKIFSNFEGGFCDKKGKPVDSWKDIVDRSKIQYPVPREISTPKETPAHNYVANMTNVGTNNNNTESNPSAVYSSSLSANK
jgi:hypothetical protein